MKRLYLLVNRIVSHLSRRIARLDKSHVCSTCQNTGLTRNRQFCHCKHGAIEARLMDHSFNLP